MAGYKILSEYLFYIENQQFEAWNKNNLGLYG